MSISRPFILRPIATSLLMAALLLVGIVAYTSCRFRHLPQVDYPTIQVVTFYPGASPEVTASSITSPLERQFGQLPGLNQMTSSSSFGASVITLQFELDENIDVAEQEVQAAINSAQTFLPLDLADTADLQQGQPGGRTDPDAGHDLRQHAAARRSKTWPTPRSHKRSRSCPVLDWSASAADRSQPVRIQANPTALASYGSSLEQLRTVVGQVNVNQAKGQLQDNRQSYTIDANDQLFDPKEYADTIIAYKNGSPVRLSDVATVIEGAENAYQAAWMNTSPAVIINIQRQPGANIIKVVDSIKLRLKQLQANLPASVKVDGANRPHQHHSRQRQRCPVRADANRRAGRDGDLSLPADAVGDRSFPVLQSRCRSSAPSE